jgi:ribosomal protein S18 acetylase RimI-like enzyme
MAEGTAGGTAEDTAGTSVGVRVITASEAPLAARLLDDFNREYDEPSPGAAWLADHLADLLAGDDTVVLVAGEADGLAVLRLRRSLWGPALEAYLAELYVVPDRRGQGIGRALLEACVDTARERGADYMDLTTTEDDVAARRLYESAGFDRTEGRPDGALSFYYERTLD